MENAHMLKALAVRRMTGIHLDVSKLICNVSKLFLKHY